jgi:tetratricopeptide (TPR) repeat protein
MSDPCQSTAVETPSMEPFEDRVDILFHELELATRWQRPSVLLAIYSSEHIREDADIALENRLHNLGQSAYHIKIKNQKSADVSLLISELANLSNVVFFVEGLHWGAEDDRCTYRMLNKSREFFIENQIRVVFWLTEDEAIDLAHFAPDYWSFRHRVIEFFDSPKSEPVLPHVLESARQGEGDIPAADEDLDAKIALRIALLTDLPKDNESTSARANLLLTLGMLHWRRGDNEKASQFLNTALDLAAGMEDAHFEALCFNAIALVETDLGRTEAAIQAYQNAISLAPEHISAWNNLGNLYRKLDRNDDALAAFQKAVEQNATDAMGWHGLGDLQHTLGRNDEAIYAFLKAIEFSPNYAPSWSGLGNCYMGEGQLEQALAAHLKAIEIDHLYLDSRLALGDIYMLQGKNEEAALAYRTVIELDPKNSQAWNKLGELHSNSGANEAASRTCQKAVASDQDPSNSYAKQASINIQKGCHAEAIPLLQKAIELSDNAADAACQWNHLGDAYRQLGDYEQAMHSYRNADALHLQNTAAQLKPDAELTPSEDLFLQTGLNFKLRGMQEHGLQTAPPEPTAITARDNLPDTHDQSTLPGEPATEFLTWLDGFASFMIPFHQHGITEAADNPDEIEEAVELQFVQPEAAYPVYTKDQLDQLTSEKTVSWDEPWKMSMDSQPAPEQDMPTVQEPEAATPSTTPGQAGTAIEEENAHLWTELGSIYFNTGAYDEAINAFKRAIELDRSYGWSYNNLAALYSRQGRFKDAIPMYQKGLQYLGEPRDKALLWNRLGDTYRRLDEHDRAAAAYRKAMQLDPQNVSLLTRARFSLLGNCRI